MKNKEKREVQSENIWAEPEEREMTKDELRKLLLQWAGILLLAIVVVRDIIYFVNHYWLGIE